MLINRNNQTGFTLIEIAIVLLIVTILLGYTVALFPRQQELKQYRAVEQVCWDAYGFAEFLIVSEARIFQADSL